MLNRRNGFVRQDVAGDAEGQDPDGEEGGDGDNHDDLQGFQNYDGQLQNP